MRDGFRTVRTEQFGENCMRVGIVGIQAQGTTHRISGLRENGDQPFFSLGRAIEYQCLRQAGPSGSKGGIQLNDLTKQVNSIPTRIRIA